MMTIVIDGIRMDAANVLPSFNSTDFDGISVKTAECPPCKIGDTPVVHIDFGDDLCDLGTTEMVYIKGEKKSDGTISYSHEYKFAEE